MKNKEIQSKKRNVNENKSKKIAFIILLILSGIILGASISLFVVVGPHISAIFQNIYAANTKNIIMFFTAICLALLWLISFIAIMVNFNFSSKDKLKAKNIDSQKYYNLNTEQNYYDDYQYDDNYMENEMLYDMNIIDSNNNNIIDLRNEEYLEENYISNVSDNNLNVNYKNIVSNNNVELEDNNKNVNTQDKSMNVDNDNLHIKQDLLEKNKESSKNNIIGRETVIRTYLKPGQVLPKGYFFDEKIGRIEKLPNYEQIIQADFQQQINNYHNRQIN